MSKQRTRKSPGLGKLYDELAQAAINYGVGDKLTIRIPQHLPKRVALVITVRAARGKAHIRQQGREE